MPQLQLPLFPAGLTPINNNVAFQGENGEGVYVHGHLPVFQHRSDDLESFRLFTSQLILTGAARQVEMAKAFQVPLVTVKRYVKRFRQRGSTGVLPARRRRSESVRVGAVKQRAKELLEAGQSVPEVARATQVKADTLHKAIRAGRLPAAFKKKSLTETAAPPSSKSERSQADSTAAMGYAATRSVERVAAALGARQAAPIIFEAARDIPQGGVLLAVPALLAMGLLHCSLELYALPNGFYGLSSVVLLLALMALARIPSTEQLR